MTQNDKLRDAEAFALKVVQLDRDHIARLLGYMVIEMIAPSSEKKTE